MTKQKRWQVYVYNTNTLKKIVDSGFKVWRWKNTSRLTIEGTPERMSFLNIKHNNIDCNFVKSPYPNPNGNSLAERINYEN